MVAAAGVGGVAADGDGVVTDGVATDGGGAVAAGVGGAEPHCTRTALAAATAASVTIRRPQADDEHQLLLI